MDWWKKQKEKTRKHRKIDDRYTVGDFLIDVLFWLPELIVIPFRIALWGVRAIWRLFDFT